MIPKTGLQIGTGPDDINLEEFLKWLAALRSGSYAQGRGKLQTEIGYCCLGVACVVLIPLEDQDRDKQGFLVGGGPTYQKGASHWLKNINLDFKGKTGHDLFSYNDDIRLPFPKIADKLEETYLKPYYGNQS